MIIKVNKYFCNLSFKKGRNNLLKKDFLYSFSFMECKFMNFKNKRSFSFCGNDNKNNYWGYGEIH